MSLRRCLHERAPAAWLALLLSSSFFGCHDTNDRLSLPPRADRVLAWLASALIYLLARWLFAVFRPTERRTPRRT